MGRSNPTPRWMISGNHLRKFIGVSGGGEEPPAGRGRVAGARFRSVKLTSVARVGRKRPGSRGPARWFRRPCFGRALPGRIPLRALSMSAAVCSLEGTVCEDQDVHVVVSMVMPPDPHSGCAVKAKELPCPPQGLNQARSLLRVSTRKGTCAVCSARLRRYDREGLL